MKTEYTFVIAVLLFILLVSWNIIYYLYRRYKEKCRNVEILEDMIDWQDEEEEDMYEELIKNN